jgi:hypothetical protein
MAFKTIHQTLFQEQLPLDDILEGWGDLVLLFHLRWAYMLNTFSALEITLMAQLFFGLNNKIATAHRSAMLIVTT